MLSLTICQTGRDRQAFEDVAEALNGHDPAFVPPFPGSVAKYLSAKSAFLTRHGEIFPIIAHRDGKPVGRIAAIVNRTHNEYYHDKTGFFGFFECENDAETAVALFEKAKEILRGKGLEAIRGPYNPSINDECGLLVFGFEKPPYIGLTWNPPFYEKLVIDAGLSVVRKLLGYSLSVTEMVIPPRLKPIADRVARRSKLTMRPINLKNLEKDLAVIREVYNASLERNWGFVPISMEDLMFAADDLRAIADPEMILIAECNGERAGVALTLPNFNEILVHIKKTPRWLRPLHVLWLMKTRRIKSSRQVVYGISPRFRDRGLHGWLFYQQLAVAKTLYEWAELGWIEENNEEIRSNALMIGAPYRRWHLYEQAL